jgi:hypothetical protein
MQGQGLGMGYANPWDRILGAAGAGAMMNPMGPMAPMGPMGSQAVPRGPGDPDSPVADPNMLQSTFEPTDALVRFFDPDVQPGKTYFYAIRVRMANPNYGKKNDVAYTKLSEAKELDWAVPQPISGWTFTPPITIPHDYYWYVNDTVPDPKIRGGADYTGPKDRDMAPVQVHRWMEKSNNQDTVGSWIIAERFWSRRGDPIGRKDVLVEAPQWNKPRQMFEVANQPQRAKGKKPPPDKVVTEGLVVEMVEYPPTLIVDYTGGRRTNVRVGKEYVDQDTSAIDMLALLPDGRLVMRNQRVDSDPEFAAGQERQQRFDQWRDRLKELRDGARPMGLNMGLGGPPPMGQP